MQAAIDKGLLDALFCADEYEQCTEIMNSVLRVLQPGGSFCIFSFSRPEFLLPKLVPLQEHALYSARNRREHGHWDDLEMKELERILLYRFIKSKSSTDYYNQGGFSEPKRVSSKAKRQ
jgi:ubiquinone/menaquinone biosynthesis C-methylase UbiE